MNFWRDASGRLTFDLPMELMAEEGCTPVEVQAIDQQLFRDKDLSVRCLEVIRSHLNSILPVGFDYRVKVVALCNHHPQNIYPAFGVFGARTMEEVRSLTGEYKPGLLKGASIGL